MIHYRPFLNSDPPQLSKLTQEAGLGRGLAHPEPPHKIDLVSYSLPYFDRMGLIVAEAEGKIVGFVHAGFGFLEDRTGLDVTKGVISALIVAPSHRKQGVAKTLLKHAEEYLIQKGARQIQAGQSRNCDPFYLGTYGGARGSGFLESDPLAAIFFQSMGYVKQESFAILQFDLKHGKLPVDRLILEHKRNTDLVISDKPCQRNFWWFSHYGNIESRNFQLVGKRTGDRIASVSVIWLDNYIAVWKERAIGLVDLHVEEPFRNQSFSLTLVTETLRKLKDDMISCAEIHVTESNPVAMKAILSANFTPVDRGIVYVKEKVAPIH